MQLIVEHEQIGPVAFNAFDCVADHRTGEHDAACALERFARESQNAVVVVDEQHAGGFLPKRGFGHDLWWLLPNGANKTKKAKGTKRAKVTNGTNRKFD
jgi:hypothetical protein